MAWCFAVSRASISCSVFGGSGQGTGRCNMRVLPPRWRRTSVGTRVRDRLTPKEMQIVALIVQGCKNKHIATQLNTKEQVIKNYLRSIYDKTGVSDRLELALFTIHHRVLAGSGCACRGFVTGKSVVSAPPTRVMAPCPANTNRIHSPMRPSSMSAARLGWLTFSAMDLAWVKSSR